MLYLRPLVICALSAVAVNNSSLADENVFHWIESEPGQTDLMYGDLPVIRYMHHPFDATTKETIHDTYKVFHHVFGPQSGKIITKGAGGKFTHHRGLYVGWNRTQTADGGFDFWHCKNGAHLIHQKFVTKEGNRNSGTMVAEIHWNDADGKPVIREIRRVEVSVIPVGEKNTWQIDWSTTLNSERGDILLRGDRQHAGFQFRAAQPVAEANSARYIRPNGFPDQAEAFQVNDKGDPPAHINLNWFAMSFPLEGSTYTVEYHEAPGQPRPSLYSERPYGRFGAFYKATVKPDKPIQMKYRVVVSEGDAPDAETIQRRYDDFAASAAKPEK